MRSSISLRLAVLTPVVFTTWFFTSALVAGQRKKSTAESNIHQVKVSETMTRGIRPQDENAQSKPAHYIYRYALQSYSVTADQNGVHVSSSVDMIDTIGDKSYAWRLRAFTDGAVEPASDVLYDQQIFSIHPSGKMSPTFSDTLPLPQGKHRVELTLYAVPKDFDWTRLNDPATSTQATVVGGIKEVSVH